MNRPSKKSHLPVFASAVVAFGLEFSYLLLHCYNFVYSLLLKILESGNDYVI